MSFFKHVGTANNKKVIIVQRQMPNEEHMAAVIYSDIMPSKYHDDVMKLLESEEGQAAYEFKDILQRRMMGDGNNMLTALSNEGYLKKVAANNVQVTPNSKSSMRLDELVKLLEQVGRGEQAVKRLERMEAAQGFGKGQIAEEMLDPTEDVSVYDLTGVPAAPAAAAPAASDATATMMMEMMKTMQAMQAEIASMKKSEPAAEKKTARKKASAV
jgi:hypothetical protein